MIKSHKRSAIISTLVLLLPMLAGLILWGRLPERMPIHWNAAGEIDGWAGKGFAVLGIPGFLLALHWLCLIVISLDPKSKDHPPKLLGIIFWICPVISVLLSAMMYAVALGVLLSVPRLTLLLCALLFIVLGNYLPKCRRNYTIGIKVMWTLDSEANWNATHRFAGKLWVAGGALLLPGALLPPAAMAWAVLAVVMTLGIAPIAYSYLYYRKHGAQKQGRAAGM